MNNRTNPLAVLLVIAFLAGLGYGAYLLFGVLQTYIQHISAEVLTILGTVLLAAFIIGLAIRTAGRHLGVHRLRLDKKAHCYTCFIKACYRLAGSDKPGLDELAEIQAQLKLWASTEVLKQLEKLYRIEPDWTTTGFKSISVLEPVVRAMRNDLGQNSLRLNSGELSW